jgi:hydrogenase maturation protein HypF
MTAPALRTVARVRVAGVVQGVGFRPFVYRLAERHGLAGSVRNESGTVEIVVDGADDDVTAFLHALRAEAPPLARIDRVDVDRSDAAEREAVDRSFTILESLTAPNERAPVPADVALCDACERELHDPANRRHRYPFITCTDCGPRYTVIEALPYDRERTTMRRFEQCPDCRREYETPGDRRYHSETNSCSRCGPRLWARLPGGPAEPNEQSEWDGERGLAIAAAFLGDGRIVALRGVGGFHLAVDATSDLAVERLRERKGREAKPLAVMVRTLADARAIARVSARDAEALTDRARPIVLLEPVEDSVIAGAVAGDLDTIGVMLAYTPLHHLLLGLVRRPLVMTSGNRSEEPIAASIPDAIARLESIADLFLLHDREIESPVDDSVVRVHDGHVATIRRARGFAPLPVKLAVGTPRPILAVGGHLKSTFTLAVGDEAFVSPHLGDLDGLETLRHYRATLDRYSRLFRVVPEVVARDLHDGYVSTHIADEAGADTCVLVQHHHAHIAAVLGEHGYDGRVLGIAYDGTGLGDDGTIWGAEFLFATQAAYSRAAHLRSIPLAGGDLAVRSPWRSALGYHSLLPSMAATFDNAYSGIDERERHAAERQIRKNVNAPMASSMGRLFDAAAAVLGLCRRSRFEGEAAMRLETAAGSAPAEPLPFPIVGDTTGVHVLDPLPLFAALADRMARGDSVSHLAAAFHESVAHSTAMLAAELCATAGLHVVALGGGSFQNARLTTSLSARLTARGLTVLLPITLPANDGGLSFGQAVVAAARLRHGWD